MSGELVVVAIVVLFALALVGIWLFIRWQRRLQLPDPVAYRAQNREYQAHSEEYDSMVRAFERLPFGGDDADFVPAALDVMDRAVRVGRTTGTLGAHRIVTILGEDLEQRDLDKRQRRLLRQRLEDNEELGRIVAGWG